MNNIAVPSKNGKPAQSPLAMALNFAARGWRVFPCHSIAEGQCTCGTPSCSCAGKHPRTVKGLRAATVDQAQIASWWSNWPEANVAIATGEESNLIVIDIDKAEGGHESLRHVEEAHGPLPLTVTIETGGGRHLYFAYPSNRKIINRNGWRHGIDVKSEGGYVIAPPSRHQSGESYRFAEGLAPGQVELTELPVAWLELLTQSSQELSPESAPIRHTPEGYDKEVLFNRARAYAARAEAVDQGGRNNSAFRLAGHVAAFADPSGCGLREDEIFMILSEEWNPRCRPPLSDSELRTVVASALKNGTPRPRKGSLDGSEFDEVWPEQKVPNVSIEKLTIGELSKSYPRLNPPVIEGVLREGEICNVISYSKMGKSWFSYTMLLSVLRGTEWLGRFPTTQGKVLLVDNELHKSTIADRIPRVAERLFPGVDQEYLKDFHLWPLRGNLCSLRDLEAEFRRIESGEYKLIVLDAMYRFASDGANENDNAAMAKTYNLLDRIAQHTKAGIVVIHHATKGSQSEKRITDVGAGAGAQSRAADCHLILREHDAEDVVVLDAAVRSFPRLEPLTLKWDYPLWTPVNGLDPDKLRTAQSQKQRQRDEDAIERISEAIQDEPCTVRTLIEKTGIGRERVKRILSLMQSQGTLVSHAASVWGNKTVKYQLVSPAVEPVNSSFDQVNGRMGMIDSNLPAMLTVRDVAELLKCSDRHVTNLRNKGRIPAPVKLGTNVRWPRKTIEAWIEAGCPPAAA